MKSIELFAGAGGLAIATANAGFEHEAVIEWDQNACDTIRRNMSAGLPHVRDWNVVQGDVCEYDFTQHAGRVGFVSGGPPCQPFSIGGKHKGLKHNVVVQLLNAADYGGPQRRERVLAA